MKLAKCSSDIDHLASTGEVLGSIPSQYYQAAKSPAQLQRASEPDAPIVQAVPAACYNVSFPDLPSHFHYLRLHPTLCSLV